MKRGRKMKRAGLTDEDKEILARFSQRYFWTDAADSIIMAVFCSKDLGGCPANKVAFAEALRQVYGGISVKIGEGVHDSLADAPIEIAYDHFAQED